ncbi:LAG1 longevity assurance-like 3 [Vitis vinifera]|uniref:LAG1 longevity assurance-like 3 n=1 Tax=Vitis vinifera TaxID=29760 RepID=A0A438JB90_VITVI|nr:LAG1 longevity assurance-like 3 [Vitis vinifera]
MTLGLGHKLFRLANMVWVPPRSFCDMMTISFKGLGNSIRSKTLWQIVCLTILWIVWQERDTRIFEEKRRIEKTWVGPNLLLFILWASCSVAFKGVPLNVIQLSWYLKLGRILIFGKGGQQLDVGVDEKRKKLRKFKESAWKCVYYLSAELLALSVTYDEPWFTNTKYFWVGPGNQVWPDQQINCALNSSAYEVCLAEVQLVAWHVLNTITMRIFARVGSVVLALHDASDVFLEVGKMSKYKGAETTASISFILLFCLGSYFA